MSTLIEKFKAESQSYQEKSNHKLNAPVDKWIWHGMARGLEKAIDIVKQHSDWISDDEQVPDNGVFVLVYLKSGHMEILQRNEYEHTDGDTSVIWEKMCCNGYFTDWDILAWQPLPQPPSEVQP